MLRGWVYLIIVLYPPNLALKLLRMNFGSSPLPPYRDISLLRFIDLLARAANWLGLENQMNTFNNLFNKVNRIIDKTLIDTPSIT